MIASLPTTARRALRLDGRRLRLIALGCVVVAAYLWVGYAAGSIQGQRGDPSVFIKPGRVFVTDTTRLAHGTRVYDGTGFDGQFAFSVGLDPLLNGDTVAHLDVPRYRYGRILLPLLGWLGSWGDPDALAWAIPAVNLLAILGSTLLLGRFALRRRRSVWLALPYALAFGFVAGWTNDAVDPLATGLLVAGVVWWLEAETLLAVVALTAAVFARETGLVVIAAIAVLEAFRDGRRGWPWLVPLAAGLGWQVALRILFSGNATNGQVETPGSIPFAGAVAKIGDVVHDDVAGAANWELAMVIGTSVVAGALVVLALARIAEAIVSAQVPERVRALPIVVLGSSVLVVLLTKALWTNPLSYPRYSLPLMGVLTLMAADGGSRVIRYVLAVGLGLALVNPLIGIAPLDFGPVLRPGGLRSANPLTVPLPTPSDP